MSSHLESLPADARAFIDATVKLLNTYMPGAATIEMMIGANVKATLTIDGGSWSKENLGEVMAHLTRYRKYFNDSDPELINSTEKIMARLERILADHRAQQAEDAASQTISPDAATQQS